MAWEEEEIPDQDDLYRRIAPHHVKRKDGTIGSVAFMVRSDGGAGPHVPDDQVSVDWARHTTPEDSLKTADRPTHGIGALRAGFPRNELPLQLIVKHTPDKERENRAHSSILGNEGEQAEENCYLLAKELQKRILKLPDKIVG